ncbi:hypothetical protein G7Z17_g2416 [Cylindrodendrum hubeiense]|uniref:Carboxylesterase type B domain-containing protein n=1 Tax=Cylindrodendrum hubeiense TaxID=595255 RepID=A0A9P5HGI6_9HYPO|nr:hypothetical protein G7Z17_g2416 [Cylindrodendrum hubeiense]
MSQIIHPQLGKVTGTLQDGIAYFRGIKYASLEHALATPTVCSERAAGGLDATRHGPGATSPSIGCEMELGIIQKSLPHGSFTTSSTECLNLNIAIPENAKGPLPVFVFVHGGGFAIGSNAWPQYDLTRIVKLSQDIGKPVVSVQINYRLDVYGFLDSIDLREAGIKPNRGLLDQKTAFEWIRDNISGFHGNPDLVTAIGHSAGSVSCTFHLESSKPLFQQLVSMSGTSLLMRPIPLQFADTMYKVVLERIQVDGSQSPTDQLKQLLLVPEELIMARVGPDVKLHPVIDGEVIQSELSCAQWDSADVSSLVPGTNWCRRLLIGDCQSDSIIMTPAFMARKSGIASAFKKSMASHLPPTSTNNDNPLQALLEAYSITAKSSDDMALTNILQVFNDALFYTPIFTIAQQFPQRSFIYHFNEPNPWEGPSRGETGHILDIAFLFQNFNKHLESKQVESARAFGRDLITFVNGKEPFPAHDAQAGGAKVYGPPSNRASASRKHEAPVVQPPIYVAPPFPASPFFAPQEFRGSRDAATPRDPQLWLLAESTYYATLDLVKRHQRTIHANEYARPLEAENTQSTSNNVDNNQRQRSPRPENTQSSASDSITVQIPMISSNSLKRPRDEVGENANSSATGPPMPRLSVSTSATTVDDNPNVSLEATSSAGASLTRRRSSVHATNFEENLVEAPQIPHANAGSVAGMVVAAPSNPATKTRLNSFDNGCLAGQDPLIFMQSLDFLGSEFDAIEGEFNYESGPGMPQNDASFSWPQATLAPPDLQNHILEQGLRSIDESLLTPESSGEPDHNVHSGDDSSSRLLKVLNETPVSTPRMFIDDDAYHYLRLDACSRLGQSDVPLPLKNCREVQRMINGYIDGFHRHLPFLHLASMKPSQTPSPLIWAMCCIGSLYSLDRDKARRSHALASSMLPLKATHWPSHRYIWEEWILRESMKRLLCSMFIKSNLLLILYDMVPGFDTSQDLDVETLEEERLWNAPTAAAWEAMRQVVIPCTKSIRDVIGDMLSESSDEDDVAEPYCVSGFTALVAVHAVNVHNWHLSQVSRTMNRGMKTAGFAPNIMLQHSLAALTRCHEVLRLSRHNGVEPMWDDPEGPMLFNCEAMLRAAYARLFTNMNLPQRFTILCASSEDRKTALRRFVVAKQERSALMTKAVAHVLESILIPIKVGYLLVQKTAAFSWSIETAVSAWGCVVLLCKWVYCIETLKLQDGPKELESRLICQVKTALEDMDCKHEGGRSLAAALGRAWASFHNDVWVWGITARLGQNLMELAELFESSYEEHFQDVATDVE